MLEQHFEKVCLFYLYIHEMRSLTGLYKGIQRLSRCARCYSTSSRDNAAIRALIIGSPGSGKGTLSTRLLKVIPSLHYLSGGDLLRQEIKEGTLIGKQADEVIRAGGLMPDSIMMQMVSTKVIEMGRESSWLLDGFPRTRGQAELFDDALKERGQAINLVLHLDVPNEVVLSRILDRWIHEPSGRTYNQQFNPPKKPGKDDVTGEPLVKRSDDDAVSFTTSCFRDLSDRLMMTFQETFKARLHSFQKSTQPMIEYFSSRSKAGDHPVYVRLQGTSSDEIWPRMLSAVKDRFANAVKIT